MIARAAAPASWAPLVAGFCAYVALFTMGHYLHAPSLNVAGALTMLYFALVGNFHRMFELSRAPAVRWALLLVAAFAAAYAASPETSDLPLTLKYAVTFVLFIRVCSCGLPPLGRSRWRIVLFVACGALVALSVGSGTTFSLGSGSEPRLSGIFANPNNLALMAFSFLFLLDQDDAPALKVPVHAAVVAILVLTHTSGAIVAYAVGLAYHHRHVLARWQGLAAMAAALTLWAAAGGHALAPQGRLLTQLEIASSHLDTALDAGEDVKYGDLVETYGNSATSGLWRVAMWSTMIRKYLASGPGEWLFGRGIGSSPGLFGNHPHNEYVRLLSETGALGLLAFLGFFAAVLRRIRPSDRMMPIVFLVYCFTENNLDNFLFMTLLILFLAGALHADRPDASLVPPALANGTAGHGLTADPAASRA